MSNHLMLRTTSVLEIHEMAHLLCRRRLGQWTGRERDEINQEIVGHCNVDQTLPYGSSGRLCLPQQHEGTSIYRTHTVGVKSRRPSIPSRVTETRPGRKRSRLSRSRRPTMMRGGPQDQTNTRTSMTDQLITGNLNHHNPSQI